MEHKGRAVVFESMDDLKERVDDPKLDVDETSVLVLKCAGPKGAPGMPECGDLPIPVKLLQVGVMDMVRISDARMTGTSYGSIALHVAPESAVGGPLAIVRSGDMIELDVAERRLELLIPEAEMKKRLAAYRVPPRHYRRGYGKVYLDHVLQANHGCDFDFLRSC